MTSESVNAAKAAKKTAGSVIKEYAGYAVNGAKYFFKNENQMWLSFLLPAMILLISYFIFGVWPVGKESVLSLDLNGQYVYYYDHMYDVLYGDESVFYSWNRNLSGEWMGIIGYYLGSPFNFIVWLFPRNAILEGLLTMMCVKVGAIGLAMSVYLSRGKGFKKLTTVIFSICYALCAYTLVQTMNPMWLDGVMALPVICLGIEKFIDAGRFRLLVAAWVYAFVTCFYIGFMLAIFSVIYYMLYMVVTKSGAARERFFIKTVQILGLGVTAVMISAYMLIPVYESLSYGKFEFSTPDYSLKENFPLIELLDKLLPNSYDTVRMTGLPFIYCGVITVLLLPAYFFCKKIRRSERLGYAAVMMLLILCMYIRPVDMMWHGGQLPNWLPYRYSFMLSFLMVVCAATVFERIKETDSRVIGLTCFGWLAVMVYQENADNFVADLNNGRDTLDNFSTIIPAMIILFTITALLVQLKKNFNLDMRRNRTRLFSIILVAVVASEALYNTVGQISTQDTDITYSNHDTYVDYIPRLRETVNEIKENDDGFYRIEKLFFRTVNDPAAVNMYGLSHSSSTLNAKPIELLKRLGFTARSHYTRYSGATLLTSSLFGVKYELSTDNNDPIDVRHGEEIYVEENEYAMPICYLSSTRALEQELTQYNPFTAQTEMINSIIDEDYLYYTRIYDVDLQTQNVNQGTTTDQHHSFKVVTSGSTASLTYKFTVPKSGKLYMYLPSTYERQVDVNVNGEALGKYFEGDNNNMKLLGEFWEDDPVTVVLTLAKSDLYFREAEFAVVNEDSVRYALNELKEQNADTVCTKPSANTVRTEVNCVGDRLLLTTIPNEKGWSVYVDGAKTEYEEVFGALIAVPLTQGQHTVEMKFVTAGYPGAVIITAAGVIIFIGIIILWLKRNPEDRAKRKAHLRYIYSGDAEKALIESRKADLEERKRFREQSNRSEGSGEDNDDNDEEEYYEYHVKLGESIDGYLDEITEPSESEETDTAFSEEEAEAETEAEHKPEVKRGKNKRKKNN
ncbi:MAG: YfhO family protein [Bacteroides sp.]|nr:YfhO family protein [Bacteroides sp.]